MAIALISVVEILGIGGVALLLTAGLVWWVWRAIVEAWSAADEGDGWDTDNGPYDQW